MTELEIKANAEQYALKRIISTDLSTQARDKILIQDAYEKGFDNAKNKIEELEKENAELNEQNRSYEQLIDTGSVTLMKDRLKNYKQLTKAKKIIKTLLRLWNDVMTEDTVKALIAEAEQFLEEIEK